MARRKRRRPGLPRRLPSRVDRQARRVYRRRVTGIPIPSKPQSRPARLWQFAAGLSGGTAVIAGAVGAHAVADPALAKLVETASLYQLIHAAALLGLASAQRRVLRWARWLFLAATVLFCGTLYLKAFGLSASAVAAAPAGGVAFILGWLVIAVDACF